MNVPEIRNHGIENSSGEYIAWMDSDDIAIPERLQKQVDFLDAHPDIDIISSHYQLFGGSTKKYELPEDDTELKYTLMFYSAFANPALMFRRSYLERTGVKYDIRFYLCEDYKFFVDGIKTARFANIPETLLRYRVGHGNITTNSFKDEKQLIERKKLIDEIHRMAIENNGFTISDEELCVFNLFFGDANKNLPKPTRAEYDIMMSIFGKLSDQAVAKNDADSTNCPVEGFYKAVSAARSKIESKYGTFF